MFNQYDAYVLGYYGMKNAGDDALMYSSLLGSNMFLAGKRYKTSSFSPSYAAKICQFDVEQPAKFRGHQRLQQYRSALNSKKLIIGGGSVFHSERDIKLKTDLMMLAGKRNTLTIGVGLGPFQSIAAEKACATFLNKCFFTGVRDKQSLDIAKTIAPKANVKLTFDLAPMLLCHESFKPKPTERHGIAFNFCQQAINPFGDIDQRQQDNLIEKAIQLVTLTYEASGEPIFLIGLNGHPQFGDQIIHQKIIDHCAQRFPIAHLPYQSNTPLLIQHLASFKAVVSMRLHAAILSYMAKTPVLPLHYHDKCQAWAKQIEIPNHYQFKANEFSPKHFKNTLMNGLINGFEEPRLAVQQAVERSLSNWSNYYEQHQVFSRCATV